MLTFVLLAQLSLPRPLSPVLELAQVFSGSAEPPKCQRRGESGQDLGSPFARFCVWAVAAQEGMSGGKLTATIHGLRGPTLVQWEVPFDDALRPARLADSLGLYLRSKGLVPKICEEGSGPAGRIVATQWRSEALAVHVAHLIPATGFKAKLVVMATDQPPALHPLLCQ